MSYFNEVAGGPTNGHYHLIDSNADWGQDMWYLKRWLDRHPEARPLHMACNSFIDPKYFGIDSRPVPNSTQPGWFAVSVHWLHSRTEEYRYFLRFHPTAMAGYSIYIYHITVDEANRVRREQGLPEIKTKLALENGKVEELKSGGDATLKVKPARGNVTWDGRPWWSIGL